VTGAGTSPGREVELKLLLDDEAAWRRLAEALANHGAPEHQQQRNLYLDSRDEMLRNAGVMLRVRLEENRAWMTCKAGARLVDGVMTTGEWETALTPKYAARWRQGSGWSGPLSALPLASSVRAALKEPKVDPVVAVHAEMHNYRQCWTISADRLGWSPDVAAGEQISLELDRTRMPGGRWRFELEVEHADATRLAPLVGKMLAELGLRYRPATEAKYVQMLRLLDGESGNSRR